MKKNNIIPRNNKNKFTPSQEQLNALESIDPTVGSTITYIFDTPRIKYSKSHPDGVPYVHTSKLVCAINTLALVTVGNAGKKMRRNSVEVLRMFEDTREDLCATSFTIN